MSRYKKNNTEHCTLCKNFYNINENSPKSLMPCGHTYCNSCLTKKKYYNCPKCNEKINQWIPDFEILDILKQSNSTQSIPFVEKEIEYIPNLTTSLDEKKQEITLDLIDLVFSDDLEKQLSGTKQIRKLLSEETNPPIQQVIDANLVPSFIKFLNSKSYLLQFESAWVITNILSGNSNQTEFVIKLGVVPIFISLLNSENEDVCEQAVWALGNISGESSIYRDLVLENGILPLLLEIVSKSTRISMIRNAVWCLSNLFRGKPSVEFSKVEPALPVLVELMKNQDSEVIADVCWGISYLSEGSIEKIQKIIEANVCQKLVELLSHSSPNVVLPALKSVGNIVTGDDEQTQVILNYNPLPSLLVLLGSAKASIRKEACWLISNITAGNDSQIQAVIDANIFPVLISMLNYEELAIKREAAWAICNATSIGTIDQIKYLIELNAVPALCNFLNIDEKRLVIVVLEALQNILRFFKDKEENDLCIMIEECGGLDKIESLQNHQDPNIYKMAYEIIEFYFSEKNLN